MYQSLKCNFSATRTDATKTKALIHRGEKLCVTWEKEERDEQHEEYSARNYCNMMIHEVEHIDLPLICTLQCKRLMIRRGEEKKTKKVKKRRRVKALNNQSWRRRESLSFMMKK